MVVPVAAKAARSITRALSGAGADSPQTARQLDGLGLPRRRALDRLLREGVVREAEPGRYWLDAAAYEQWRAARLHRALWVLLFAAAAFIVLLGLGIIRS